MSITAPTPRINFTRRVVKFKWAKVVVAENIFTSKMFAYDYLCKIIFFNNFTCEIQLC